MRSRNSHATSASFRREIQLHDRIYGIIQTYGIRHTPYPEGETEFAKIHSLEDEFGMKLVAKAPLLSQILIYASPDSPPRRSWLVTQECKADDLRWELFSQLN